MSFGAPQWFWGLLALPALAFLFVHAERTSARRLRDFVSPKLLPQLAGAVDRFRRMIRFGLLLLGLACAVVALAQPRWGYIYEDVKRKGIDLLIGVDTSRSMLSNDVQPNRLERVKLATQDLINELRGDRVGLIAFAGRAFVQAPLTIDYDAVVEAIRDLDTKTIPEGGTNISEAISLAQRTYGKSAVGNRALVIFTDGEDLSGDAVKTAQAAADAGVRIFTIGVGTPQGSLIPVAGENGGNEFVKDAKGQVVKSKLDEGRLEQIAKATGGFYLHLENGPHTMQQVFSEGISKMKAADMDVRSSRKPIERYEWPLGAAIFLIAVSIMMRERKRARQAAARKPRRKAVLAPAATALLFVSATSLFASAPGLDLYHRGDFPDAYQQFQETLRSHPQTKATDKLQFDSGAAAYKMKDYGKALESFSEALLSPDSGLQSKSHYNLGNTLYERGADQKTDEKKLADWQNALQHYEQTLKLDSKNNEAKENYEFVKKQIEDLKNKQQQQPSPSPSPSPKNKDQKNDKQQNQDQQKSEQSQEDKNEDKDQQQKEQQQQSQPQTGQNQKPEEKQDQSQGKDQQQKKEEQSKSGQTPSPSPGDQQQQGQPSPSPGEEKKDGQDRQSPSGENEQAFPTPSPGEGEQSGEGASPSPAPSQSPQKKMAGEIKGANDEKSEKPPDQNAQMAEAEAEKEGEMSERQAEALLRSMKDEEARVQLDERKVPRHVYNDW